jgi:hypothetical protein
MVFPQSRIHAQQITLSVVLLLQIFRRLNPDHAAEIVLSDDAHAEIFRLPLLLTFLCVRSPFGADDDECCLCRDFVRGRAAETNDECLRFLAAKR